jgi:hypothetical protein
MVNFVTIIPELANDVLNMIETLGFKPHVYRFTPQRLEPKIRVRYTIRLSKQVEDFVRTLQLEKR